MTGHPFGCPADAAGHSLTFIHPPERDYLRTAACTGCGFQAPAPGTGYARARRLHSEHHARMVADQGTGARVMHNSDYTRNGVTE